MDSNQQTRLRRSRWYNAYFAFHKAATTVAYASLIVLTWRFADRRLDWQLSAGCLGLSAFWIFLMRIKLAHFLQTYFDVFSRLEFVLPAILGVLLSVIAFFAHGDQGYRALAIIELVVWIGLIGAYYRNKRRYEKRGYGAVPSGTWISPPISVMSAGDLILTSGNVAKRLHETVGHAAAVVADPHGRLFGLSSHMDRGTTLDPIDEVVGEVTDNTYLLLKLAQPIDQETSERLYNIAQIMVRENEEWKNARNQRWLQFVDSLPLSDNLKQKLRPLYHCTGYDWVGTLAGRLAPHRWTCIGAALDLYHRAGIHTNPYGTGLLGFGTTLFDPIMPVRFLADPAFHLLMKESNSSRLAVFESSDRAPGT